MLTLVKSKIFIKLIESYFMKRIINAVILALLVVLITACGRPTVTINSRERENYEKKLAGEKIVCAYGLDANGSCLEEGDDGIW